MDFHGNIDLLQNNMQQLVWEGETDFPTSPLAGRVVFKDQALYICVAFNGSDPIWIPITNKIDLHEHDQSSTATTWTITHNLNVTAPILQIYDTSGKMLIPDSVVPTSNNVMEVTFNTAQAGTAVVLFGSLMPADGVGILEPSSGWTIDLGTFSYASKVGSLDPGESGHEGMFFRPTGENLFIIGTVLDSIEHYSLSTAWDISTLSYDSIVADVSADVDNAYDVAFSDTGDQVYVVGIKAGLTVLRSYPLSVAWDITTLGTVASGSVNADTKAIFFNSDGTKMVGLLRNNPACTLQQYTLSTAWDITSMTYDSVAHVVTEVAVGTSVFMNQEGTQVFVNSRSDQKVF